MWLGDTMSKLSRVVARDAVSEKLTAAEKRRRKKHLDELIDRINDNNSEFWRVNALRESLTLTGAEREQFLLHASKTIRAQIDADRGQKNLAKEGKRLVALRAKGATNSAINRRVSTVERDRQIHDARKRGEKPKEIASDNKVVGEKIMSVARVRAVLRQPRR
jgi:hypothetical protein